MKKLRIIFIISLILLLIPLGINLYVIMSTRKNIYKIDDINNKYDIALVLGCGVKDNKPSLMLQDRLDKAIELYENDLINYIIITGDEKDNEVTVMFEYLISHNISNDIIIKDEKGFSTSESLVNFKNNYLDKKIIIITQNYHLYRALYIAKKMQIEAIGLPAKKEYYAFQTYREFRELLARVKDYFKFLANYWY